jgi:hypothetical protein
MRALIGVSSELTGAVQQSVCHETHCVYGAACPCAPMALKERRRNGTNVPRVKLTAARAAFLHGVSDELMERA